ncbi:hypothetical protein FOC4_g10010641 [Fusarium odoratissimum]|uniref:Uncharacterized protein n=1 Tax=Fusarium oxysporum f. sp. cubense (strain race 4) TaxID=2502994 RepID=N1REP2_FUSC4|nr:hypothetical protein FOC4_g10010641 [Fusarium odoratissimum]
MTPNSPSNHSKGLPASAEQALCPNPLSYIISKLSPQMSCSAGPSNEENSQRKRDSEFVEDEIQALIEQVINVPDAHAILAEENTEADAQYCGTQPTTTWAKQIGCVTSRLQSLRDSLMAIPNCLRNLMWKPDRNNDEEESDNSGYTSGESFQSNGTSSGSYQQTGQNRVNSPTGSRIISLIKGIFIDE